MLVKTLRRLVFPALALLSVHAPAPANGAVVTLLYVSELTTPLPTPTGTEIDEFSYSWEQGYTILASEIGTNDAGATRYEVKNIESKLILHQATTTVTYVSEPTTNIWTEDHATSTIHFSAPAIIPTDLATRLGILSSGIDTDCTVDRAKGTGECVQKLEQVVQLGLDENNANATATTTRLSTWTYSGTLVPFATATTNGGVEVAPKFALILGSMLVYALMMVA